ncbi:hypothetical protein Tco_0473042 [Tanacetum coccineum]
MNFLLPKLSPLVDDDVGEEEAIKNNTKVVNNNNKEDELIEVDEVINIKKFKNHPLDQVIGNLNQRTLRSQAQNHSTRYEVAERQGTVHVSTRYCSGGGWTNQMVTRGTGVCQSEEFSGELAHADPIPPGVVDTDSEPEEEIRLAENLSYDNSSPRPPEERNSEIADTIVESLFNPPTPSYPR